jgi:DNA-binding transcriptional regulator GbsR (MarR family)
MPEETVDQTEEATHKVADTLGGLMELWGFRRALGRMWATMYLSQQPMHAQELGEKLGMSAGAVSMTLQELVKWGVVKRTWRPGDRRDYYEPETSIWIPVQRDFRERELKSVRAAIETFETAVRTFSAAQKAARPDEKKRLRFVMDRMQSLISLAKVGEALLSSILEGKRVDPNIIKQFGETEES